MSRAGGSDDLLVRPAPARSGESGPVSASVARCGDMLQLLPLATRRSLLAGSAAAHASAGDVLLLPLPTTRGSEAGTLWASVASGGDVRLQLPRPMSTACLDSSTYEKIEEKEVELKQQNRNFGIRPYRRGNTQRAVGVLEAGEQWQAQP